MSISKLELASKILKEEDYTCVVIKQDKEYTSKERGVKPLLDWISIGDDFKGASAADKVVGKAAAFLYVLLGIKEIYSIVISQPAYSVLKKYNIEVCYDNLVPAIKNRANTGFCPMESAVLDLNEPEAAYERILATREKLLNKNNG